MATMFRPSHHGKAKNKDEEQSLSTLLDDAQRGALMVLISEVLEHMRKIVFDNFEQPHISSHKKSEQEENADEPDGSGREGQQPLQQSDQTPRGLDPKSEAEALRYFDDWRDSVVLRVGEVLNERREATKEHNLLSTHEGDLPEDLLESGTDTTNRLQQVYCPFDNSLRSLAKAERLLILHSLLLLLLSLKHYNAYSRVLLLHITSSLGLTLKDLNDDEAKVARGLLDAAVTMTADEEAKKKADENRNLRKWKVGFATVAGAALIGITGGLAAPLVAAGLGTIMGGLGLGGTIAATYLGALASSGVIVGGLFGAYGGKMTGKMMDRYAREVEDFAFIPARGSMKQFKDEKQAAKEDHRLRVTVGITGWATEEDHIILPWRVLNSDSEVFALRWEYEALLNLGNSMRALVTTAAWKVASHQILVRTIFAGLMSALLLPVGLMRLARIAANPFSVAISRADKAGEVLADALINKAQGERPVTLVGYSLGSRVIYSCLRSLAKRRAYGLIESAILMGSPIPADLVEWQLMRAVVSGRLVNIYSEKDSVLALLYRATHFEVDISGLQAVKEVPTVENVNVSETVNGHLRYQHLIGKILEDIGFEEIDEIQLSKEKDALRAQDEAIEKERANNERKRENKLSTKEPAKQADRQISPEEQQKQVEKKIPEDREDPRKALESDEEEDEEKLNFITMIDEEEEAELKHEIAQRTHEQLLNRKMRQMDIKRPSERTRQHQ
ncbi:hypothetical protein BGW36DRAFT_367948 [Talaromyces proteolyticus]|uniref:DUF726-domain-containing protein n=1 Tax=Talaromyces proteolyticus TaxID=1131652 RepID=A0AAD4L1X4_9EURO|nr:uncharacterized protein BGW36DRAFT_367948 [Talaromyces proteolyticus]KAH8705644.1 hypothetical protein BGW36DRAFT_367948 [Talaromyces proteolyticus]